MYKISIVIEDKTQLLLNIIDFNNQRNFEYSNYLLIFILK